jgi:hypothetical protein
MVCSIVAPLIGAAIFYGMGWNNGLSEPSHIAVCLAWIVVCFAVPVIAGLCNINRVNEARGLYASARLSEDTRPVYRLRRRPRMSGQRDAP